MVVLQRGSRRTLSCFRADDGTSMHAEWAAFSLLGDFWSRHPFWAAALLFLNGSARRCTQSFCTLASSKTTYRTQTDDLFSGKPVQVGLSMQWRVNQDIPLTCATTVLLLQPWSRA